MNSSDPARATTSSLQAVCNFETVALGFRTAGKTSVNGFFASGMVTASAIIGDLIAYLEGNLGHTPRAIPTPARTDYTPEVFEEI